MARPLSRTKEHMSTHDDLWEKQAPSRVQKPEKAAEKPPAKKKAPAKKPAAKK
tara:strand:+ start:5779 stop:5937 length:159 start_codon:yes stop_codon:yes gene_type:complete